MSAPTLSVERARRLLVGQAGLDTMQLPTGSQGLRELLQRRRCIQLDPLDPMGTNADLVAMARVDGVARGDVYRELLQGHAFEHFAKERCLLPASAFPYYRDRAVQTPWWRLGQRLKRLPEGVLEAVLDEVRLRGPLTAAQLADHGRVQAIDWSGWTGTSKAGSMALEVLWTRCQVVVCGRQGRRKVYDLPERALPEQAQAEAAGSFERWALLERVQACGLMAETSGPWWSTLKEVRRSALPDELVREGALVRVRLPGARRSYLVHPATLERAWPEPDDRMRIIAPLDPLIWDRKLVHQAFGFEYLWEVYKPAAKRRWGWYVCPLLHRGELVGRIEARVVDGWLSVSRVWPEAERTPDPEALRGCLQRHAQALGVEGVRGLPTPKRGTPAL